MDSSAAFMIDSSPYLSHQMAGSPANQLYYNNLSNTATLSNMIGNSLTTTNSALPGISQLREPLTSYCSSYAGK